MAELLLTFLSSTGFGLLTPGEAAMIVIGLVLLYLGIVKKYEPLLLIPIGFGVILGNMPLAVLTRPPTPDQIGGLFYYLGLGLKLAIYPPLIFLGVGALTDFGPLIADPKNMLLGAAAQFGIFSTLLGARALGFSMAEAGSIAIIGGADGPTAIFLTTRLSPELLAPIAVAAYSYIALVPVVQPPLMRLLTTRRERAVVMHQLRPVSRRERIAFPLIVTILSGLLVPDALPLVGMLMLGNLLRECGVVDRLAKTAQNQLNDIVVVFLTLTIGATAEASRFFSRDFLAILVLGLAAFAVSTIAGLLMGKLMYLVTNGRVNPLIGAAGVSAVPTAARVANVVGRESNPNNFLLMHAMGPNVAGVIGSAVAAGVLLALLQ